MSLSQDGSKNRQLFRFCASNAKLQTCTGVLGMVRDMPGNHKGIINATAVAYERFATRLDGAPEHGDAREARAHLKLKPPMADAELERHLREITRVRNTDAAWNELLAGKEASRTPGPCSADARPLLPNLAVVNRDKAHASRRLA